MNRMIMKLSNSSEFKLVFSNIGLSVILKGISLVISLINTRLYIIYFNDNIVLGGWYAIVSILNWIMYFDLGVGNGMRNNIVIPLENRDYNKAKTIASTGYIVNLCISTLIVILGIVIINLIDWNSFLNIPATVVNTILLRKVITISLIGVGINFFLKTITSIYQALRKTAVTGFTAVVTNSILCLYLFISKPVTANIGLLHFSIIYVIASVVPFLVLTTVSFMGSFRSFKPSFSFFDFETAKAITSLGLSFFAIQVALLVVSSTDSWLISYFFNPKYAVSYQVYYRLFSISLTIYALFSQTTWSSVTKYSGENNNDAIKHIYKFLLSIAILGGTGCLVLAYFYKYIVGIWLHNVYSEVYLTPALLFALWMTIQMFINASTAIANGLGKLKVQAIFVPVAGVIKIIIVIIASKASGNWYSILIANLVCLIPLLLVQHFNIIKYFKNTVE